MATVEVLLTEDELDIIGGPASVELQVDIGPEGDRGSYVWVGLGNPPGSVNPSEIQIGDLYINAQAGQDYAWLYQYLQRPAGATWVQIVKLNPSLYNTVEDILFTSGVGTIDIPITDITSATGLDETNFSVQVSIQYSETPVVTSIVNVTQLSIENGGEDLRIALRGAKYDGTTWSNLDAVTPKIHIAVAVI